MDQEYEVDGILSVCICEHEGLVFEPFERRRASKPYFLNFRSINAKYS